MKFTSIIDDSSYTLNFYPDNKDEVYHYSQKEHLKISKVEKSRHYML